MQNKLLLISGPTASGKTKLALDLAKNFNGEIISADSRQVYRQMDIVTGKDTPKDSKFIFLNVQTHLPLRRFASLQKNYNLGFYNFHSIPVYGLDLVKPDQSFDVSDFVKIARFLISHIQKKGKLPIIVGGTVFWLKNLISPAETIGVPVNLKLRQKLEKLSVSDLQQKLKKLNPVKFSSLNNSDINNPRRLIRAIEIYSLSIEAPCDASDVQTQNFASLPTTYNLQPNTYFWLSLNPDPKSLQFKISDRVKERIKNGATDEVKELASKYSWDLPSMSAIGYQDLKFYLLGEKTLLQVKSDWILHEIQYAKRQLTFLKKLKQIHWFDLQESGSYDKINTEINKFIFC